jgi:hypothetical protein
MTVGYSRQCGPYSRTEIGAGPGLRRRSGETVRIAEVFQQDAWDGLGARRTGQAQSPRLRDLTASQMKSSAHVGSTGMMQARAKRQNEPGR